MRSPLSPNPSTWPNLSVSCYWLLRAEKAIDDKTRAEPITVVPCRLAMRKGRRVTNRQRATFYMTGTEHSPTRDRHWLGAHATPCHATQRAAWEALQTAEASNASAL